MNKKYLTFLFLFFIGIGLILPNYNPALANGGDWVQDYINNPTMGFEKGASSWAEKYLNPVIEGFFAATISAIFAVAIAITSAFLGLGQFLLSIVVSPTFINVPFTNNPFVDEGLKVTKDLTNILIVLGLVVIALSTILRISSYQMKKTLPLLLIVALLINFTPMFCGLAIDASNIVMNHFLKGGGLLTSGFISKLSVGISAAWDKEDPAAAFGKGASILGFNIFGGLIFLLFAILFLFRYVALWMLIILSPLALFCIIFTHTKKMWNMWLSQFMQWCFIGIPIAFTIHLANIITIELVEKGGIEGVSGGAQILGYLVPLTFLIFGFFMSLQIGAMGANVAITSFKKGGVALGKATGRGIEKGSREARKKAGEAAEQAIKPFGDREESPLKRVGMIAPRLLAWTMRKTGASRALMGGAAELEKKEINTAEKDATGASMEKQEAMLGSTSRIDRIGALKAIVLKNKSLEGLNEKTKDIKLERAMRDTLKSDPDGFRKLSKILPELTEKIAGKTGREGEDIKDDNLAKRAGVFMDDKDITKYGTLFEKLTATAEAKDIEQWDKKTLEKALGLEAFHKSLKGSKISAMAKQFGDVFFETFEKNARSKAWYKDNAPAAHKYIASSAGEALGIGFKKEEESGSPEFEKIFKVETTAEKEEKKEEKKVVKKPKKDKKSKIQYEGISKQGKKPSDESAEEDDGKIV